MTTQLHDCGARTDHAREAQLFAGFLTGAAYSTANQLDHVTTLLEQAELHRAQLVERARAERMSWTKIGQCIGITKQAAQQRYGKKASGPVDPDQLTIEDVTP